jgi:hypothetical protein
MMLHITKEQIFAAGARPDCRVFADLERVLGPAPWDIDWTRSRQIELMRLGLGAWITHGWLSGLLPHWQLAGAHLAGADLAGAFLRGADLFGASLAGANLRGADLYGANLRCAVLEEAELRGANLHAAEVCVCPQASCLKTFRTLLGFGWSADKNGRLSRLRPLPAPSTSAEPSLAST